MLYPAWAGCRQLHNHLYYHFRQWHGVHGNQTCWQVVVELLTVISSFGMQIQEPALTVLIQTVRHVENLISLFNTNFKFIIGVLV